MVDEIEGRMWAAHHEAFGEWVGGSVARLRSLAERMAAWDGSFAHLSVLIMSVAVTALTFNTTAI